MQHTGHRKGFKCLVFLCPSPETGIPLANTDPNAPSRVGVEQWFASLSPFLAMG
jgi:hypothetical protein